jgi:outer membrane lipoprotein-sorting protein
MKRIFVIPLASAIAWLGIGLGHAAPAQPTPIVRVGIQRLTSVTPSIATRPTSATRDVTSGTLRMLRTLNAFHKDVKTIHATFHQSREDEVFLKTVQSEGELWFRKPYFFRVDYANPQPMITLILEKMLYSYVPELKEVDCWSFDSDQNRDQQMHQLLLGFGQDEAELVRLYRIHSSEDEAEPLKELVSDGMDPKKKVLFYFTPRPQYADGSPFVKMKLFVDKATHMPEKIWYEDSNDANMTLAMKKIQTDVGLDDALFNPNRVFPSGVEYIDKRAAQ